MHRQSFTAPRGWLDRAGIQFISRAHQFTMALLICGDQRRALFPGDRDEGRRLLAEETGGPRLPFQTV